MLKRQNIRAQFAICIENSGYPKKPLRTAIYVSSMRVVKIIYIAADWFVFIEPPKAVLERMQRASRATASQ